MSNSNISGVVAVVPVTDYDQPSRPFTALSSAPLRKSHSSARSSGPATGFRLARAYCRGVIPTILLKSCMKCD